MTIGGRLGIQLYGKQILSDLTLTHGSGGNLLGLPLERLGIDFIVLGGRAPGETFIDVSGGASVVPVAASALCVLAPKINIITRLSPWCLKPAHIARIGANLDRLSHGRWQLLLDFADTSYAAVAPSMAELSDFAFEVIDTIHGHWRGPVDHDGHFVRSVGRIVGPRPEDPLPKILIELPPEAIEYAGALSDRISGIVVESGNVKSSAGMQDLLHSPVVVRDTTMAANAIVDTLALPADRRPIAGTADSVCDQLMDLMAKANTGNLVVSFPALTTNEIRLFAESLAPQLRPSTTANDIGMEC